MIPFWTSFLVRTYAWMFLLRDTGLINSALIGVGGIIREPLPLLYNNGAVLLGLVYSYLPFVVLPLFATLERLDNSLLEASADLGARPWETMTRVVIPLCAPAFRAAAVLVFIPCLGAYLTPDLLGGGKTVMAGNLIQNQFTTARDWPFGSAVSLVLMAIVADLAGRQHEKPERGPALRRLLPLYATAAFAFLHLPLLVLAVFSVNSSRFTIWQGFSLRWYEAALHDTQLAEAAWNSLVIALAAHVVSTCIGTLCAYASMEAEIGVYQREFVHDSGNS